MVLDVGDGLIDDRKCALGMGGTNERVCSLDEKKHRSKAA